MSDPKKPFLTTSFREAQARSYAALASQAVTTLAVVRAGSDPVFGVSIGDAVVIGEDIQYSHERTKELRDAVAAEVFRIIETAWLAGYDLGGKCIA